MPYFTTNATYTTGWIPVTNTTTTTTNTTANTYGAFNRIDPDWFKTWRINTDWVKTWITPEPADDNIDVDQDAWLKVMQPA